MMTGFDSINDYDWIIERDFQSESEQFTALIKSFMPQLEDDDLVFCLFEKVTLTNKSEIGDIHIFSSGYKDEKKEIISKYKQIINEVQSITELNPAEHEEWYELEGTYYYVGKNTTPTISHLENKRFTWYSDFSTKEGRPSFDLKKGITDKKKIIAYLNLYLSKLNKELFFTKYPFYVILVKPISVINPDRGTIYPLGNLFMHFGFKKDKEKDEVEKFFKRLINRFWVVWFRTQGHILIEEIQSMSNENQEQKSNPFMPKLTNNKWEKDNKCKRLKCFLDTLNTDEQKKSILQEKSLEIINNISNLKYNLLNTLDIIKLTPLKEWEEFEYEKTIPFLLRRKIVIASYLVLKKDIKDAHSLLITGNMFDKNDTPPSVDTLYMYFWENLLLSTERGGNASFGDNCREKLKTQLSEDEISFLKQCINAINSEN